jgi:hypothetical protein
MMDRANLISGGVFSEQRKSELPSEVVESSSRDVDPAVVAVVFNVAGFGQLGKRRDTDVEEIRGPP